MDIDELVLKAGTAKAAARKLAHLSTKAKNDALAEIALALESKQDAILAANRLDYDEAEASGMDAAMLDRLLLTPARIKGIADDVRTVAKLPDPVGEISEMRTLPNGMMVGRRQVPLGVIGAVYESRPNVTVDIASLCLKSGNAVILRGGKEAVRSNAALANIVIDACGKAGVPQGAVSFVESTDRALVGRMLKMNTLIDLMIPRGGAGLIKFVVENATMPVIAGGIGVCHTYVDARADLKKALAIVNNAKTRRPTICNAMDTVIVHTEIAGDFLPRIAEEWGKTGVEMRCDNRALAMLEPELPSGGVKPVLLPATVEDWGTEFLAMRAGVKVVDSLDEAIDHIDNYGSGHSEAIVTEDYSAAMRFLAEVDAAAVYVNASTQFTDGAQFGLGAEVGISTQKLHARGPMGLKELTTYKWIIMGSGQTRPS